LLMQNGAYVSTADSDRPHLFVEATKRAFADHASWLTAAAGNGDPSLALLSRGHLQSLMQGYNPGSASAADALGAAAGDEDPGSSGFVVADRHGLTIPCEVTMNRRFGHRR